MAMMPIRPRRLRQSAVIRRLVREHALSPSHVMIELAGDEEGLDSLEAFGGVWVSGAADLEGLLGALQGVRGRLPGGCVAVDLRGVAADAVEAVRAARSAGADVMAVNGADTAVAREGLEAAGDVHALLVACASFEWGAQEGGSDFPGWVAAGADLVLIEPALPNLDRIRSASERVAVPVMARCTPTEWAMYRASFECGWLDEGKCIAEALVSMRRAGARIAVAPMSWGGVVLGEET